MPARLSRCVQPRGHGPARQGDHDRRLAQESRHRRLHLREGPQVRSSASTGRTGCCIRRSARAAKARGASSARRGTRRSSSSSSGCSEAKSAHGAESILPYSYGGSNGLLTQDNLDAQLWRRFGTSRLARTVCAAPTGAANLALYGKMPSVTYQDYPEARLIILWGVNPSASGIHLVPYVREAQKRGAKLVVVDPAHDAAREIRRRSSRGERRDRRRRRARDSPLSVHERARRCRVPARPRDRGRRAARTRGTVDDREGRGGRRRRAVRAAAGG